MALTWRSLAWALYVAVNLAVTLVLVRFGEFEDWEVWRALPAAIGSGTMYQTDTQIPFVWSPVAAYLMAGVALIGYWPWVAVHVVALWFLRFSPWLMVMAAASWSFWVDTVQGSTMTFVLVAGILALRGSRPAGLIYIALCALVPRPIQLPLLLYLLWHDRSLIAPGLAIFAIHTLLVVATGYAGEWATVLLSWDETARGVHWPLWAFVVSAPVAVVLTWRGWVGFAGLLISPYIIPQYWWWPLVDLSRRTQRGAPFPATLSRTTDFGG